MVESKVTDSHTESTRPCDLFWPMVCRQQRLCTSSKSRSKQSLSVSSFCALVIILRRRATCPRRRDTLNRADPANLQTCSEMQGYPAEPKTSAKLQKPDIIINDCCFKLMIIWVTCHTHTVTHILILKAIFKSKYFAKICE